MCLKGKQGVSVLREDAAVIPRTHQPELNTPRGDLRHGWTKDDDLLSWLTKTKTNFAVDKQVSRKQATKLPELYARS